jgi:hypothetical protein
VDLSQREGSGKFEPGLCSGVLACAWSGKVEDEGFEFGGWGAAESGCISTMLYLEHSPY